MGYESGAIGPSTWRSLRRTEPPHLEDKSGSTQPSSLWSETLTDNDLQDGKGGAVLSLYSLKQGAGKALGSLCFCCERGIIKEL